MAQALGSLLLAWALLGVFAWVWSERMIFLPPPPGYANDQQLTWVRTADGVDLAALWFPNPEAAYTLLYSHGNAEDIGYARQSLEALRDLGFNVFAYDYRGYGHSRGRASERGTYRDIEAAYRHLTSVLGIPADRIIAQGVSVGAGPTVDLAVRHPVAGVVVESGFVSAFRVMTRIPLFPFDRYRNAAKLRRMAVPVLVIHGTDDDVVGAWHGPRLHAAARMAAEPLWVQGAGHNDLRAVAGPRYGESLRAFAASLGDVR